MNKRGILNRLSYLISAILLVIFMVICSFVIAFYAQMIFGVITPFRIILMFLLVCCPEIILLWVNLCGLINKHTDKTNYQKLIIISTVMGMILLFGLLFNNYTLMYYYFNTKNTIILLLIILAIVGILSVINFDIEKHI